MTPTDEATPVRSSDASPSDTRRAAIMAAIRDRRTNLFVDRDRDVPPELLDELCEAASWAPCHKRTWPWCFAVVTGDGRDRLGKVLARAVQAAGADEAKVAKTSTKYLRAPAIVVVGARSGDTPERTAENRYAVSAAVQNLLLAATAAGLASFWSSCPAGGEQSMRLFAGFGPETTIVAMVYVGWPIRECPSPSRPAVDVVHIR